MGYEIHDTHGAPKCGCEVTYFGTWRELVEHLDANPALVERIERMEATIVENRAK